MERFAAQERGARVVLSEVDEDEHLRHLGVAELDGDRIVRIVEKPAEPPSRYAVTGAYFYDEQVWEILPTLEPSGRGELEITDLNNWYVERGEMEADVLDGFWGDAGESIDAYYAVNDFVRERAARMIEGLRRFPLAAPRRRARLVRRARARERAAEADPAGEPVAHLAAGVIRGLHYHERGQDDLFVCLAGMVRVVVLDRTTGETFSEDIGDENPVAIYVPGHPRARLRGADRRALRVPRDRGVRRGRSRRARHSWDDPRVKHLWSIEQPILSARDAAVRQEAG